jgi:poly(3-hydroxybutyrate) depolymerase
MQPTEGQYGVFNGSRLRAEIAPRIADFVMSSNDGRVARPAPLKVVARN